MLSPPRPPTEKLRWRHDANPKFARSLIVPRISRHQRLCLEGNGCLYKYSIFFIRKRASHRSGNQILGLLQESAQKIAHSLLRIESELSASEHLPVFLLNPDVEPKLKLTP